MYDVNYFELKLMIGLYLVTCIKLSILNTLNKAKAQMWALALFNLVTNVTILGFSKEHNEVM